MTTIPSTRYLVFTPDLSGSNVDKANTRYSKISINLSDDGLSEMNVFEAI